MLAYAGGGCRSVFSLVGAFRANQLRRLDDGVRLMIAFRRCMIGGIFVAICTGHGAPSWRLLGRGGGDGVGGPQNG